MIRGLRPYPAIKESGVPWLGSVPSHWHVRRCRYLFRDVDHRSSDGAEQHLSMSQRLGLIPSELVEQRTLVSENYAGGKLCEVGDLVLNRLKAHLGVFAVAKHSGVISPDYTVFRPIVPGGSLYFEKVLRSAECRRELRGRAKGIVEGFWRLYTDDFYDIRLPVPPLEEQLAIVAFVDYVGRQVRRYIRAKQRLIALLEEQKQAIIHRAVSRGLDPNVRLKSSGVEWLGDVPEHWDVVRLGRVIELVTGFPFKSEGFTQSGDDIRLLRGVNITPGRIRWTAVVRWAQNERENYSAFELQIGDIVLGMDRPIIRSGTRVATVGEADIPALLLQRVARIRPTDDLGSNFLTLLLSGKAFADYLTPIFTGISVPHLSPEQIKSFRFALPAEKEQQEIVRWVARHTKRTSATLLNAEREIQLLREYRTRLIADVVTGKLDVREAAARLPVEAEVDDAVEGAHDGMAQEDEMEAEELEGSNEEVMP